MRQLFKTAVLLTLFFSSIVMVSSDNSYALKEIRSTTADLARSANGVVLANCVKSEARIDEETGLIFTYTTFKVDERLKGEYGDEIVLRIIGGTVGDISVSSPYLPKFTPNEDVILILGPNNTKGYPLLKSISRGILRVETDDTGTKYVTTPVDGLEITNSATNERSVNENKVNLDDFIYSINEVM